MISHLALINVKILNFQEKVFKSFYSDQASWNFLDTCGIFSIVLKFFESIGIEKEYDKKRLMNWFMLQT